MFKLISIDPCKCKCGLVLADISTKKVEGSSNFGILGIPFSFIEILIGMREDNIIYKEFTSNTNKNKSLENDFEIKGKLWIFGLGISF